MIIKNLFPTIDKLVDDNKVKKDDLLAEICKFLLRAKRLEDSDELQNVFSDCVKTINKLLNDKEFWYEEHKLFTDNLTLTLKSIHQNIGYWNEACLSRKWTEANLLFQKISSFSKEFCYD